MCEVCKIRELVKRNRKLIYIVAMALILFGGIVVVLVLNGGQGVRVRKDEVIVYASYGDSDQAFRVCGTDKDEYVRLEGEGHSDITIYVANGMENLENVYVMVSDSAGNIVLQEQVLAGDDVRVLEITKGTSEIYDVSFVTVGEEGFGFYVSTEEMFMDVVSDSRVENQNVYMLCDIEVERYQEDSVCIGYPFVWNTQGYKFCTEKTVKFFSEESGHMVINNAGTVIETRLIECSTPLWTFDIEEVFEEFGEEHYFYIKALSVNDKDIDTTAMYVDSADKLNRVLEYGVGASDKKIGKIVVPDDVVHLTIVGDYELGEICTDRELVIEMVGSSDVAFDAAGAELIWKGEKAPVMEDVEHYMNVKAYNGVATNKNIGGYGSSCILSGSVKLSKGGKNDMVLSGNFIDLYTGYADNIKPTDAAFDYKLSSDGSARIIEEGGDYYCVVTDSEGKTRGYKINIITKEYKLPVINVQTDGGVAVTSKETKVPAKFTIKYNGAGGYSDVVNAQMDIKGRGHSSWLLEKKPYKIKFDKKVSLFGLTAAKEWVLQANHADKSLIRNKLATDMGAVLNNVLFTPHTHNVDVFVNGQYVGVYTLVEQIEVKDGRIEGEKDSVEVDTDYLLELGGDREKTSFGDNMFSTYLTRYVEIKNPDSDVLTLEQYNYIKSYVYNADKAVENLDGYEEYIDIPSLIDWFILNEFSYNTDCTFRRSVYMMKKKGGKLYMATYWDYDYAFGNLKRDSEGFDEWICYGNEKTAVDNYIWDNWMRYLLKDENFTKQLKARWEVVKEQLYRTAMATIDEAQISVLPSAQENFTKWTGVLGKQIQFELWKTAQISTYEGQLQYLRDFVNKRYKWMDKTIRSIM